MSAADATEILTLSGDQLDVITTMWDPDVECVAIVKNGVNDETSIALTRQGARDLAAALLAGTERGFVS